MTHPLPHKSSAYMHWAKTQSKARYNLATSGVAPYPLRDIPASLEQITEPGEGSYGAPALVKAIAERYDVPAECVVTSQGTSMANHLAMAAILEPGDEALIEEPTYELLTDALRYLGADIRRFPRRFEAGFQIDVRDVERAITPRTRLIVISNLHNPSSTLTSNETLRQIGELARSVHARVLVDEVYLDALFEEAPPTSFLLGPEFVVTSSLTKVYGLSSLRCGWVFAEPDLAMQMRLLNDLYGVVGVQPGERYSCLAFANLEAIRERSRRLLQETQRILNDFLARQEGLECSPLTHGTVIFPRLTRMKASDFCRALRDQYETSVVPGAFFGSPDHFRIGIGVDAEMQAEGLRCIETLLRP